MQILLVFAIMINSIMAKEPNSFSCKLTPEQCDKLANILQTGNYKPVTVPYTQIAVKSEDFQVNLYTTKKVLVQGKGWKNFVEFVLEPEVLGQAVLGYEEIIDPKSTEPHMGIDESGKGDFFGPLVAAAAYTDPNLSKKMIEIGVKDCKKLTDKQIFLIGKKIREALGVNRYKIVSIGPEAYNKLYHKYKNVNRILSWAHARCIENLLTTIPSCPRAVADQFGAEHLIKNALMKNGQQIILEQHHKAESDIAVAAASILAREHFLTCLENLGKPLSIELPKGASPAVVEAGINTVKTHGPETLLTIAKCHFRTTDVVFEKTGNSRNELGEIGQVTSRAVAAESNTKKSGDKE